MIKPCVLLASVLVLSSSCVIYPGCSREGIIEINTGCVFHRLVQSNAFISHNGVHHYLAVKIERLSVCMKHLVTRECPDALVEYTELYYVRFVCRPLPMKCSEDIAFGSICLYVLTHG